MLEVALRHHFGAFTLDAAFAAPPGVTVLFGASGAGKTSVAHGVAGLLRPEAGRVALDDAVLLDTARGLWTPPHRRRVGYVFQDARLFPHLSVRRNLDYGRRARREPEDRDALARIAALLGIEALLDRRPGALSGGERQRVAIGRALLMRPRVLVMDEPLASLDAARKAEILPFLERLRDEAGVPILYVSHAMDEVVRLATTVVALHRGRVLRTGSPAEVLADPEAAPALGPRGAGALLQGRIAVKGADGLTEVALPAGRLLLSGIEGTLGAQVRVRVAAEDVMLALDPPGRISALNVLEARVVDLRPEAPAGMLVQLEAGGGRLLARITARSALALGLRPGLTCHAVVKAASLAPRAG